MQISANGIAAIRQREGCRLNAYLDTKGVPTIGVGHTGPEVRMGLTWTQAQVDMALLHDLGWAIAAVNDNVKAPLNQNQFDALVSLVFNIGAHAFSGSSVLRQLNMGNYHAAAQDFMMWIIPRELTSRRVSEMRQFLG